MNSNTRRRPAHALGLTLAVCAVSCLFPHAAHAGLFVDLSAVPLGGGTYQYDVSVSNNGPEDLAIVSLTDAPLGDALIAPSLTAPAAFSTSYDSVLGFVDFLADVSFAAGTTVSGFSFLSTAVPTVSFTSFEALTIQGDLLSGQVRYPRMNVPDTGSSLVALSFGLAALRIARRKAATA